MENILAHYGIDWFAMALNLYATHLLVNKRKVGFLFFSISNIFWIILGIFFMSSYGMAIGSFVFFLINLRGFYQWSKEAVKTEIADINT